MRWSGGKPDPICRRPLPGLRDDELLWIRLFRTLDDIDAAIVRLERAGPDENRAAVAAIERLRGDIVAALRLAAGIEARP